MIIDHIEIAKLELQRGDILVMRTPADWDMETRQRAFNAVQETMRQAGISGVPVLIGGTDVDFQIIRKDAA
jgi:hypothetical protein